MQLSSFFVMYSFMGFYKCIELCVYQPPHCHIENSIILNITSWDTLASRKNLRQYWFIFLPYSLTFSGMPI